MPKDEEILRDKTITFTGNPNNRLSRKDLLDLGLVVVPSAIGGLGKSAIEELNPSSIQHGFGGMEYAPHNMFVGVLAGIIGMAVIGSKIKKDLFMVLALGIAFGGSGAAVITTFQDNLFLRSELKESYLEQDAIAVTAIAQLEKVGTEGGEAVKEQTIDSVSRLVANGNNELKERGATAIAEVSSDSSLDVQLEAINTLKQLGLNAENELTKEQIVNLLDDYLVNSFPVIKTSAASAIEAIKNSKNSQENNL